MSKPGISVVICCFNSASRLEQTLKHLSLQTDFNDAQWELIVVDNASTDDTLVVAKGIWNNLNKPDVGFKMLHESMPGKSYALKKGIEASAFDYILVCDDDNWLHANYLTKAFHRMEADPTIGVLGGCGVFHPEKPMRPEITGHEIAFVNGAQTWAQYDHWVYGAGSLIRRETIFKLFKNGWTPLVYGKNADKIVGEDVEICYMYYLNGYQITSDDALLFEHFVPLAKQRIEYILNLVYRQAYAYILLTGYRKVIDGGNISLRKELNKILITNLKAWLRVGISMAWRWLKERKKIDFNYHAAMNTYKGAIFAVLANKNKIISHFETLSNKHLINQGFQ